MWAYPSYLAGFQTSFAGATIFIALKEHPLLNLIFQIGEEPMQTLYRPFSIHPLRRRGRDGSVVTMSSKGIVLCNVYRHWFQCSLWTLLECRFHFIWQFNDVRLPEACLDIPPRPYIRARAPVMSTTLQGCMCRVVFRLGMSLVGTIFERLRPLTGCLAPTEACTCHICRRQPPTLRDTA
jgi:hypothetical protein